MSGQDTTYRPGLVPDDPAELIQFLFDELQRIAAAIEVLEERITALEP